MILTGNIRLGRDSELRFTAGGTAVANLIGVYDYGRKGDDDKKPSQWVELALFGNQAEALAPYLLKGAVLFVSAGDVHVEIYNGKNGVGSKLVGKVTLLDFAPSQPQRDASPQPAAQRQPAQRQPAPAAQRRPAPAAPAASNEFEDDIPF